MEISKTPRKIQKSATIGVAACGLLDEYSELTGASVSSILEALTITYLPDVIKSQKEKSDK